MNAIAPIGHNQPPEETAFEATKVHLDDLLSEAHNFADGVAIETQEQANAVQALIDQLREGADGFEALRVAEKKPLDDQIAAIQDRFNVYLAPLKNKKPGKVWLAIDALNAAKRPYLLRLEAEQQAAAAEARRVAEEAARVASEAARAAQADDLSGRELADAAVEAANAAMAEAKRAEAAKAHANGGGRASGLRSYWRAELTDRKAALVHYASRHPDDLVTWLTMMAAKDVQNGVRSLPGFEIVEERR